MLHMIRQGIRVGNRLLLRVIKQKTILIYIKTGLLKIKMNTSYEKIGIFRKV